MIFTRKVTKKLHSVAYFILTFIGGSLFLGGLYRTLTAFGFFKQDDTAGFRLLFTFPIMFIGIVLAVVGVTLWLQESKKRK